MSNGFTIAEAAKSLGVSTRTIRRFIKAGKLKAELVPGQFGEEYLISEIPAGLRGPDHHDDTPITSVQMPVNTTVRTDVQPTAQYMDIIRELQEKNLTLAAHALGLGTVHIGMFDAEKVRQILGIPEGVTIVEMLVLGWPDEKPAPRPRKETSEFVAYDKYSR